MCKVSQNMLSKQSRTDNNGWFFSLGVRHGTNNSQLYATSVVQNVTKGLEIGRILWHDLNNEKCIRLETCTLKVHRRQIHRNWPKREGVSGGYRHQILLG